VLFRSAPDNPTDTSHRIPSTRPRETASALPTVLVFRDGRRVEVVNYAVVGHTLWIFSEQRARRIALVDLDLEGTRRANEERGVEFDARPLAP